MSDAALLSRTVGDWRSVDAFLDHLANRPAGSFILPHEAPDETVAILTRCSPEHLSGVLAAADTSLQSEISLLGRQFRFAQDINWNEDPVTGWRWPLLHRSRIGHYLGPERPVDLILFWELNRHQHFISLGIAFWLTGDERYVNAFSSQILSWIDSNPVQHGINWFYGLEASIRLIAWTVAFQFFRTSARFRRYAGSAFLKSLWQQTDFVSNHLQTSWLGDAVPNNHMIAELAGVTLVAAAFPEFREATAWRTSGLTLLNQQARAQTHPDGVNKEQATGYHRFVAELLLLLVARSRQGALPDLPILEDALQRMLDYVLFTSTPAGTAPMWGDADYGRALRVAPHANFWDFRPLLSTGAVLFRRPDWKFAAGRLDEESVWLLGADGLRAWDQLPARPPQATSRAFRAGGVYVIRDGWAADGDFAVLRCGPFGLGGEGQCAHAHCDLLSVVLWVAGRPLLVDSGTYTYHGPWRDYFRLTAAHNTVLVDGHEQATPLPNFNWRRVPRAECVAWTGTAVTGRLAHPGDVTVTRELSHLGPGRWQLVDAFAGHGEAHQVSWFLHFAPALTARWNDSAGVVLVDCDGKPYVQVVPPEGVSVQIRSGWSSSSYGTKEATPVLEGTWHGLLPPSAVRFRWMVLRTAGRSQAQP